MAVSLVLLFTLVLPQKGNAICLFGKNMKIKIQANCAPNESCNAGTYTIQERWCCFIPRDLSYRYHGPGVPDVTGDGGEKLCKKIWDKIKDEVDNSASNHIVLSIDMDTSNKCCAAYSFTCYAGGGGCECTVP